MSIQIFKLLTKPRFVSTKMCATQTITPRTITVIPVVFYSAPPSQTKLFYDFTCLSKSENAICTKIKTSTNIAWRLRGALYIGKPGNARLCFAQSQHGESITAKVITRRSKMLRMINFSRFPLKKTFSLKVLFEKNIVLHRCLHIGNSPNERGM